MSPVRAETLPDWLLASRVPGRQALHGDWVDGGEQREMPWGVQLPRRLGFLGEGSERAGRMRDVDGH